MAAPTLGRIVGARGVVSIDLRRLLTTRLSLQATSGAGKSWALRRILEQTCGQVMQIVLDVEGDFHTLRERGDYILAGARGDCPATTGSAALFARKLLELGTSAIVSIDDLKADERIAYVQLFLESLMSAPRSLHRNALVVVDEAQVFAPQGEKVDSTDAVVDLMTRGRKRGLCGILATQRVALVEKNAWATSDNKAMGRASLDVDIARAARELGFARERWQEIQRLEDGHFFVFGPALSRDVVQCVVGPVQTTHPQPGARQTKAAPPRGKVLKVLAQLKDLPAQAVEEAQDLAGAKAQLVQLRRELAIARKAQPPPPPPAKLPKAVEVPVIGVKQARHLAAAALQLHKHGERMRDHGMALVATAQTLQDKLKAATEGASRAAASIQHSASTVAAASVPAGRYLASQPPTKAPVYMHTIRVDQPKIAHEVEGINAPKQDLLNALAYYESIDVRAPRRSQVALVAKVSSTSSGFEKNLGRLRVLGLVDYPSDGTVALTDKGRGIAQAPEVPPTSEEVQAAALRGVNPPKQDILRQVLRAHPRAMSRDDIASACGVSVTSSGFEKNLGTLRSLGLITYPSDGMVAAAAMLFV